MGCPWEVKGLRCNLPDWLLACITILILITLIILVMITSCQIIAAILYAVAPFQGSPEEIISKWKQDSGRDYEVRRDPWPTVLTPLTTLPPPCHPCIALISCLLAFPGPLGCLLCAFLPAWILCDFASLAAWALNPVS